MKFSRFHLLLPPVLFGLVLTGPAGLRAQETAAPAQVAPQTEPVPSVIPRDPAYLAELIAAAKAKKLHEARYWLLLLHYRHSWSEADGEGFFFAEDGNTDPAAELEATLTRFFDPPAEETPTYQHPLCQFPERNRWLREQLSIDPEKLPQPDCPRYRHFRGQLDPGTVTFVFSAAYVNNPASMYGHTFLRVDRKGNKAAHDLLSYMVNFAAYDGGAWGPMYAIRGVFGGFRGTFSTIPYYLMVQKYSNAESRDLWEYRLNLTEEEIDRMVRHMWELGNTWFSYWFFDENCSYHILSLIEVARPELHLREEYKGWVIPTDTVHLVTGIPGLVSDVHYRPAITKRMVARRELLTPEEEEIAARIVETRGPDRFRGFTDLPPERQIRVLDAAGLYFQIHKLDDENEEQRDNAEREMLLKRTKIPLPTPDVPVERPDPPEQGHGSSRLGIWAGANREQTFEEIHYRGAIHDLLGNETGFPPASQLEIGHIRGRYENKTRKFLLEQAEVLRITSLFPYDPWVFKLSWKAHTGIVLPREKRCPRWECLSYYGNAGAGITFMTKLWRREVFYAFVEAEGAGGGVFESQFRIGPSFSGGLLFDVAPWSRIHGEGRYLIPVLGDRLRVWQASVFQSVYFGTNWELRAGAQTGTAPDEVTGGLYWHF